jgi:hypothetical protein
MKPQRWIPAILVIGGGLLLLLLLFGGPSSDLDRARCMKAASNGRQVHLAVFDAALTAQEAGPDKDPSQIWPVDAQYSSSTEFLKAVVSNEWLRGIDFSFFSAPSLKPMTDPTAAEGFRAEHNAWCIVTRPVDAVADWKHVSTLDAPFMFTKNIGFGSPPRPPWPGATIADMTGLIRKAEPFGGKLAAVVTYSGKVKILTKQTATQINFNPQGMKFMILSP